LQAVDKIDGIRMRDGNQWDIFLNKADEDTASALLKEMNPPIVAIHPGARNNKNKRWRTSKFTKLCDLLFEQYGAHILLVGGKDDRKLCNFITKHTTAAKITILAGKLTLLQTAAVLKRCNLLIGHASGPTYIASAVGTPVVAIHGPDSYINFGALGDKVKVVSSTLKCSPCLHFYRNFLWGLRVRYIPICWAMQKISVEQVFDACCQQLKKDYKPKEIKK
jgi:ADP-heptose:LPS heptosyltransferase